MEIFVCCSWSFRLPFSQNNSLYRLCLDKQNFRKYCKTKLEVFFKLPVVEVAAVVVDVVVVVGVVLSVTSTQNKFIRDHCIFVSS